MYDTQALGILALNGALVAAAVAAKDPLGKHWWLALIGLLASSVFSMLVLSQTGDGVGPRMAELLDHAPGLKQEAMDELVARRINEAWTANDKNLRTKRKLIGIAIALLGATIAATIVAVLAF